jgi:CHAD domain-containing protein
MRLVQKNLIINVIIIARKQMSTQHSDEPVKVNMKKFVNTFKRNISRVSNKLDDYLSNPDEKNIHDIRTSVRRLDTCYKTLPSKMRKKKQMKIYIDKSKELFKINSQIRDYDVITDLIRKNNHEHGTGNGVDLTKFENRRESKLEEAKVVAVGLEKLSVPKVDKENISAGKLTKRYNKLISRFGKRIQLNLPLVMTNADKVNELHEMRKDCKKLRYLLELVTQGNSSIKNLSKLEEELQNMQDLLGAVHDCDAAVAYLNRTKRQRRNDIIERIVQERKKRYEDFLIHCKSDTTSNKYNSLLLSFPRRSN